ncbi:unnamed protein product [Moneuplotes crassus]|uniref:Uncharacterized protein n=1 Tax=Euplotes crassus TaxID=5936 RepID=A0AAD1UII3_EUPCR|nr:unnamed protein product [Moneuplotes crassus]
MDVKNKKSKGLNNIIFRKSLARLPSPLDRKIFQKTCIKYRNSHRPSTIKSQSNLRIPYVGETSPNEMKFEQLLSVKKVFPTANPFSINRIKALTAEGIKKKAQESQSKRGSCDIQSQEAKNISTKQSSTDKISYGKAPQRRIIYASRSKKINHESEYFIRCAMSPNYSKADFVSRYKRNQPPKEKPVSKGKLFREEKETFHKNNGVRTGTMFNSRNNSKLLIQRKTMSKSIKSIDKIKDVQNSFRRIKSTQRNRNTSQKSTSQIQNHKKLATNINSKNQDASSRLERVMQAMLKKSSKLNSILATDLSSNEECFNYRNTANNFEKMISQFSIHKITNTPTLKDLERIKRPTSCTSSKPAKKKLNKNIIKVKLEYFKSKFQEILQNQKNRREQMQD